MVFSAVVIGGMELLNVLIPLVFYRADRIPDKSKTLAKLEFWVRATWPWLCI